ncbi:MAG: DUF937 domain-containing protein [Bacteriovorax sp.]
MTNYDSLIDISQNFFTPDIVQKISGAIGQSSEKTKAALQSAVPAFLSGMIDKGSTPEGASKLVDMVNSHNYESNMLPDESRLSEGNDVVNNIFGSNLNNTVSKLGTSTGLSTNSVTKMLGLVAPVFMGAIGSKVKNENLNSSGLMNFFRQQKNALAGFSSKTSDYYLLSGANPEKDLKRGFTQRIPWMKILLASLILFGIWFWWQHIQVNTSMSEPMTGIERGPRK